MEGKEFPKTEHPMSGDLIEIRAESESSIQQYLELQVSDPESLQLAADGIAMIRKMLKRIEDVRKRLVKPLNDGLSLINAEARKTTAPLKEAEKNLTRQTVDYRRKVEEARKAEEARLRKLAEARQHRAEVSGKPLPVPKELRPQVAPPPRSLETAGGGKLTFQKIPQWKLEDIAKVPGEYLQIDRAKITKVVRAGVREIPGIRIWVEDRPVSR